MFVYLKEADQIINGLKREERREDPSSPARTVYQPGTLHASLQQSVKPDSRRRLLSRCGSGNIRVPRATERWGRQGKISAHNSR